MTTDTAGGSKAAAGHPARRVLLLGAATVGVAVVVADRLSGTAPTPATAAAQPLDESTSGYRLSAHVQRYYETARH